MKIHFNFAADSKVTLTANGQTETVDLWGRAHKLLEGHAGRINVYDAPLSNPSAGAAVRRSDGRTTVSLLKETGPIDVLVALDANRKGLIRTPAIALKRGFSSGRHYWLAQGPDGRFKPEPGRRHRKIYVSGSAAAMDRAAIAAHAGVAENVVTGAWLAARPQYGGSTAMPITETVRQLLTPVLWGASQDSRSDWLLYERGHSYEITKLSNIAHMRGESELHPLVFGAWGNGARPVMSSGAAWETVGGPRFLLIRDLQFTILVPKGAYGIIFENCRVKSRSENQMTNTGMATLREVAIHDVARAAPRNNRTTWHGSEDRISGMYTGSCQNLMLDSILVDRCGWAEGYDPDCDGKRPQPPSDRNHGLYLTHTNRDLHVRDSMITRNSSAGLQSRYGGQIEGNLFVDNNVATLIKSSNDTGEPIHQFTNFIDNVNFGAGYKKVSQYQGAIHWGFACSTPLTAQIGSIVAHLANPDDPDEVAARKSSNSSRPDWDAGQSHTKDTAYIVNDIQVYGWNRSRETGEFVNTGVDGLDPAVLNQTTIQRFAAQTVNQPKAGINDLVEHVRDDTENRIGATVRAAVGWTKARFGRPLPARTAPADPVFRPDPRTEGFRWDNRLNWSTLDLPGTHSSDSADLDGHDVLFGTLDRSIVGLRSRGGTLDVTSGRLFAGGLVDAADITVRDAGQLVLGAATQPVAVRASGGRVHLTGAVSSLALEARGNAEVLLGPDARVPAGRALVIGGERTLVGWDGTGTATLTVAGTLEFRVGITLRVGGTGFKQRYVELGRRIEAANFAATIGAYEELAEKGNTNKLVLTDVTGLPVIGDSFVCGAEMTTEAGTDGPDADLVGTVTSIFSRGLSPLQVFRSGAIGDGLTAPTVTASVVLAAGSIIAIDRRDLLTPGTYDLTGPGVTVTNNGATLPAGVTVTGGKMVLTVS